MGESNEYNYADGKTKKIISRIEKDCLETCAVGRCCEFRIKRIEKCLCDNCKINKEFMEVVGVSVIEFI